MNLLRELFAPDKSQCQENFIWYNEDLKKCCWGSIKEFELERECSSSKDNCKLICKPEIDSKNCREIVYEINLEFRKKHSMKSFTNSLSF